MKQLTSLFILFCLFNPLFSQNIGIGTATPDASAKLDISATDRGVLVPRVSLTAIGVAAPVTAPATGLLVYNTNALLPEGVGFYYWDGTQWLRLSTLGSLGVDVDANDGLAVSYPDVDINVNNGLSLNTDNVQLGGTLIQNTTVTQDNFGMIYDLTGTGHFEVRKSGATDVFVSGTDGNVGIGTAAPAVKLAINGAGTNVYATDLWTENNIHVQGNETLGAGGRGRLRVGTAWGYSGLYTDGSSTGKLNDLILGSSSGIVRVGPGGSTGQVLSLLHGGVAANLAFTQHQFQALGTQAITNVADQYTVNTGSFIVLGSGGSRWQSFTAAQTGSWIQLKLGWANATGSTTLNIYSGEGNGGTLLLSMTIPKANGLQTYTLTTPVAVTAGNKYTFEVMDPTVNLSIGSAYAGGYYNGNGTFDLWFEEILASQTTSAFTVTSAGMGGRVGIGTHQPSEILDIVGNVKFSGALMPNSLPGTSGQVLTSAGTGVAPTWTNVSSTLGTDTDANDGLTVTYPDLDINTSNGLSLVSDNIKLGGALDQGTTVTQGAFDMIYDVTGVGNFEVRKSGATDVFVSGTNGNVGIGASAPAVKLAVKGNGTNVYNTDVWVENNMHIQGNETMAQGGRGRLRIGSVWGYNGLYAEQTSTAANNDLILGASSGIVRVGPGGASQQNLYLMNGINYATLNSATNFPYWASNSNGSGTAVFALGNGLATGSYLPAGSGGAFNGTITGLFANSTTSGTGEAIYTSQFGQVVRVNYWNGTQYKILGTGTVSTTAEDLLGNRVVLHAAEAPEIYFEDYGQGQLINGKAHIEIDPIFAKNVAINEKHPLRVFIQLEGESMGVKVINKTTTSFDVVELGNGTNNIPFQWHIVCNRADEKLPNGRISKNEDVRFETAPKDAEMGTAEVIKDNK